MEDFLNSVAEASKGAVTVGIGTLIATAFGVLVTGLLTLKKWIEMKGRHFEEMRTIAAAGGVLVAEAKAAEREPIEGLAKRAVAAEIGAALLESVSPAARTSRDEMEGRAEDVLPRVLPDPQRTPSERPPKG